ncbi:hypothetical protein GCM10008910_40740 [Faecalicatena orotica]|uniref:Uncharacterized protein n=1 Tax=Faecalicatena orotica TaxID=1544 RepID=A0A2Y9BKD9_9FIRM|nr:hypothetical protein A8806_116112 [Faecalicatena orotica]SSA58071.1 hypothetical protein SAMN05216536_116112 [Faecalicatena orotica]
MKKRLAGGGLEAPKIIQECRREKAISGKCPSGGAVSIWL